VAAGKGTVVKFDRIFGNGFARGALENARGGHLNAKFFRAHPLIFRNVTFSAAC
jgi:hypothetical protein